MKQALSIYHNPGFIKGRKSLSLLLARNQEIFSIAGSLNKFNPFSIIYGNYLSVDHPETSRSVLLTSTRMMCSAPKLKPTCPNFSSGPCKKHPNYSLSSLPESTLGRSHRSSLGKSRLSLAISETHRILNLPSDYIVGIVPASDTGAYEMLLWNVLGDRNVDICHWESFGKGWYNDVISHLKLRDMVDVFEYTSPYGQLPDLSNVNPSHDLCFTYNGTTSGVRVPNCDFISDNRTGLTLCDATSAVFAMSIPWNKLDAVTFSWQKVLGGEGAHGMVILSPRLIERLENYTPPNRPLPKIFRLTKNGKLINGIFHGATINTPSMLCIEDYISALSWVEDFGGVDALIKKSEENLSVLEYFVKENDWINFLAKEQDIRSCTSVCLTLDLTSNQIKHFVKLLEQENVALDIGGYRDAPPSIRIWCGGTVETEDVEKLMPWLTWAYKEVNNCQNL